MPHHTSPSGPAADKDRYGQELEARLANLGRDVDGWTREAVEQAFSGPGRIFGAMLGYHLGWRDAALDPLPQPAPSGKKLRPALALLVSEAVCGSAAVARTAAVALELVHNFSLVHDDIQDNSALRRHRPTLWTLWGAAQGINAGDALFALAQTVLLSDGSKRRPRLARALNEACLELVEGQYLDLELQHGRLPLSLELYELMIARKTGALFAAACRLGAIAGGALPRRQEAYARFGLELGIAFQEQDDVLGVWGDERETGKPQAADVVTRKRALPVALALSASPPAWLVDLYASPDQAELSSQVTARVIRQLDDRGARAEAEARVVTHSQAAITALQAAGGREPARSLLLAICATLRDRRS